MDCIKPGHRTRQGPGQDGQCQQAAEVDKTKEEAAETHGSTPAAASTTLKVEASNGIADGTATSTFRPERPTLSQGGTDSSNPLSSSGESGANLIFGTNPIDYRRGF